jgi:hypothetical protein
LGIAFNLSIVDASDSATPFCSIRKRIRTPRRGFHRGEHPVQRFTGLARDIILFEVDGLASPADHLAPDGHGIAYVRRDEARLDRRRMHELETRNAHIRMCTARRAQPARDTDDGGKAAMRCSGLAGHLTPIFA